MLSAHILVSRGRKSPISAMTISAPSPSWMSAAWTLIRSSRPCVSTARWRLRPLIFFPGVVAAYAAHFGCLDRLTIDNRRTGLGITPLAHAVLLAQAIIDTLEGAILGPGIEVVAHAIEVGVGRGQIAPLTAR